MSYDGGASWVNIADTSDILFTGSPGDLSDTIPGGMHAFTGRSKPWGNGEWTYFSMWWIGLCKYPQTIIPDSIMLRFSFKSDNIQTNKEGWMVDDIVVDMMGCPIGVSTLTHDPKLNISPNPLSFHATLQSDIPLNNAVLTLFNSFGQQVRQLKNISGQTIIIERGNLPRGLYFIRLTQANRILTSEKIIIADN